MVLLICSVPTNPDNKPVISLSLASLPLPLTSKWCHSISHGLNTDYVCFHKNIVFWLICCKPFKGAHTHSQMSHICAYTGVQTRTRTQLNSLNTKIRPAFPFCSILLNLSQSLPLTLFLPLSLFLSLSPSPSFSFSSSFSVSLPLPLSQSFEHWQQFCQRPCDFPTPAATAGSGPPALIA